ncbi:MAG: hypothetical protein U0230_21280 [Polyangiales bacterium]
MRPSARGATRAAILALLFALPVAGCSTFTAPATPSSSCRGKRCELAIRKASRDLACDERNVLARAFGESRVLATGCARQAEYVCSRSSCRRRGDVRSLDVAGEVRYRASLELFCPLAEVLASPTSTEGLFEATCRGTTVRYRCSASGCEPGGPTDPGLLALRQLEPSVLECTSTRRAAVEVVYDARGEITRVTVEGVGTAYLRSNVPHGVQDRSGRGCLARVFRTVPPDPDRAGETLVVGYGAGADAPESLEP